MKRSHHAIGFAGHRYSRRYLSLWALCCLVFTGCAAPPTPASAPENGGSSTSVAVGSGTQDRATASPVIEDTAVPTEVPTEAPVLHSLPETNVNTDVKLAFLPEGAPLADEVLPANTTITLLGKGEKKSTWYRVVSSDTVGWIEGKTTGYPAKKLPPLREPPPCAKPRGVSRGLDGDWESPIDGQLVVVVDLFRDSLGSAFQSSVLQVKLNDAVVVGKDRRISSSGQFLLRGTAIPIGRVKKGNHITFGLVTDSVEPVKFFATFFTVPDGCAFKE